MSKLEDLLTEALSLVGTSDDRGAARAFLDVVPTGVKLYASKGSNFMWDYYLSMPNGWVPTKEGTRWLYNANGYYWDTGTGVPYVPPSQRVSNTKQDALKGGLIRLLEAL